MANQTFDSLVQFFRVSPEVQKYRKNPGPEEMARAEAHRIATENEMRSGIPSQADRTVVDDNSLQRSPGVMDDLKHIKYLGENDLRRAQKKYQHAHVTDLDKKKWSRGQRWWHRFANLFAPTALAVWEVVDFSLFSVIMGFFVWNVPFLNADHLIMLPLFSLVTIMTLAFVNLYNAYHMKLSAAEMAQAIQEANIDLQRQALHGLVPDHTKEETTLDIFICKAIARKRARLLSVAGCLFLATAFVGPALFGIAITTWSNFTALFAPAPYLFLFTFSAFAILTIYNCSMTWRDYRKAPQGLRIALRAKGIVQSIDVALSVLAVVALGFFLLSPYGLLSATAILSVPGVIFIGLLLAKTVLKFVENFVLPSIVAWQQKNDLANSGAVTLTDATLFTGAKPFSAKIGAKKKPSEGTPAMPTAAWDEASLSRKEQQQAVLVDATFVGSRSASRQGSPFEPLMSKVGNAPFANREGFKVRRIRNLRGMESESWVELDTQGAGRPISAPATPDNNLVQDASGQFYTVTYYSGICAFKPVKTSLRANTDTSAVSSSSRPVPGGDNTNA
ncbi:MAG: hypothetical protein DHS20C10_02940 [marine bacterium B5-7]|nr:MAG: hypothetical protein DHS20C10_02940 [marine bacterium B5-7]